jgi:hypothetical protein
MERNISLNDTVRAHDTVFHTLLLSRILTKNLAGKSDGSGALVYWTCGTFDTVISGACLQRKLDYSQSHFSRAPRHNALRKREKEREREMLHTDSHSCENVSLRSLDMSMVVVHLEA